MPGARPVYERFVKIDASSTRISARPKHRRPVPQRPQDLVPSRREPAARAITHSVRGPSPCRSACRPTWSAAAVCRADVPRPPAGVAPLAASFAIAVVSGPLPLPCCVSTLPPIRRADGLCRYKKCGIICADRTCRYIPTRSEIRKLKTTNGRDAGRCYSCKGKILLRKAVHHYLVHRQPHRKLRSTIQCLNLGAHDGKRTPFSRPWSCGTSK